MFLPFKFHRLMIVAHSIRRSFGCWVVSKEIRWLEHGLGMGMAKWRMTRWHDGPCKMILWLAEVSSVICRS